MAERKVLTKYYPPDFDPAKIPRLKKPKDQQQVVRLMAPYSMRCNTCGEYIYKGRKFNARKETVLGEDYYGVKIFRFYIRCTRCSAEITFKTDPKNTDYAAEHGASRNHEPWRAEPKDEDGDPLAHFAEEERLRELEEANKGSSSTGAAKRLLEEGADPMATLEARQAESKREMDVEDALQDIRTRNARLDRVDAGDVLERLAQRRAIQQTSVIDPEEEEKRKAEAEDEALVRKFFSRAEDMGGEEEAKELRESLAGGGAPPGDLSPDVGSPREASSKDVAEGSASAVNGRNVVVKRALADISGSDEGQEPDPTSLLSDRAKALLGSTNGSQSGSGSSATVGGPASKKKKKGPNAFGIVKKKAAA